MVTVPGFPKYCIPSSKTAIALSIGALGATCILAIAAVPIRGWWRVRKLPIPSGSHLVLGHVQEIEQADDAIAPMVRWYREVKSGFAVRILWDWIIFVYEPADLKFILTNPRKFNKNIPPYRRLGFLLGQHGLVTDADEDSHARMRAIISPAFGHQVLRELTSTIFVAEAAEMINRLQVAASADDGSGVNVNEVLSEAALHVVAASLFSMDESETADAATNAVDTAARIHCNDATAENLMNEVANKSSDSIPKQALTTAATSTVTEAVDALEESPTMALARLFRAILVTQVLTWETMLFTLFPNLMNTPRIIRHALGIFKTVDVIWTVRDSVMEVTMRVVGKLGITEQSAANSAAASGAVATVDADGVADDDMGALAESSLANGTFLRTIATAVRANRMSMETVRDNILTLLFAGHETTSGALTWTLAVLALPENAHHKARAVAAADAFEAHFEERVREETLAGTKVTTATGAARGGDGADVTVTESDPALVAANVASGRHLYSVCKEVLRYINPVPMVARGSPPEDVKLPSGLVIPGGSNLSLCIHLTHHLPAWGPDADVFDPTRWDDERRIPDDPYLFVPFLHGKRNCIGRDFAVKEYVVLLSAILRNFDFAYPPGQSIPSSVYIVTVQPKTPLRLIFKPRTATA